MTKVIFEISSSLDGYVTAANVRPEEPMGDGGQQLHEWAFGDDQLGQRVLVESQAGAGASIAGRRTYDLSVPWWGADGPGRTNRTPTFVVSHRAPQNVPENSVYTFVSSPLDALEGAKAAAGERDVDVFSASIGQQLLQADVVDEVRVHIAPVLLGAGTRLLDSPGEAPVRLRLLGVESDVGAGSKATHLRYAVIRDS